MMEEDDNIEELITNVVIHSGPAPILIGPDRYWQIVYGMEVNDVDSDEFLESAALWEILCEKCEQHVFYHITIANEQRTNWVKSSNYYLKDFDFDIQLDDEF